MYLAFDERLHRRVAVKALRGDRRVDGRARLRMLREARALSQLEHPNICRLYELIETSEADFLVMELVPGRSLREVMRTALPRERRLDLAVQIARALVTAHGLSVVHRDLKPENVMVTPEGVVKVLDFGLAKSFGGDEDASRGVSPAGLPDGATLTAHGTVMGTPRSMSPEQARGEPATAASDMYSFGLLLQELFTGTPPVSADLPLGELIQKASWGDSAPVEGLPAGITSLITELKALQPHLRPTAQGAMERLCRIADAPRRRLRTAIAAALAVALLLAVVVSSLGFLRARRARLAAETAENLAGVARDEAEAVIGFLRGMLAGPDPRGLGIHVKVVDVLDRAVASIPHQFAERPLVEAGIRGTLGETYLALGQYDKAAEHLGRAEALLSEHRGSGSPEALRVRSASGRLLHAQGLERQAETVLRDVMRLQVRAVGTSHPDYLSTQLAWAQVRHSQREHGDIIPAMFRALPAWRRVKGADHPDTLAAQHLLGQALMEVERFDEAHAVLSECLERRARVLGEQHADTAATLSAVANLHGYRRDFSQAEALHRRCAAISEIVYGPEHPVTLKAWSNVAWAMGNQERFTEVERITRPLADIHERVLGEGHPNTLVVQRFLAHAMFQQGRRDEAAGYLRRRVAAARRLLGEEHRTTLELESQLSFMLRDMGRPREAERVLRRVLEVRERVFGRAHVFAQRARRNLAAALRQQGRVAEAEALEADVPPSLIEEGFRGDIYRNVPPPVRPGAPP